MSAERHPTNESPTYGNVRDSKEGLNKTGGDNSMISGGGGGNKAMNYLANLSDPADLQVQRAHRAREKYNALLKAIKYNDGELAATDRKYKYENDFFPFVYFFKYLAKKPLEGAERGNTSNNWGRLKLWVPDTIVCNDGDAPPMWIFSSPEGYVYRTDTFNSKHIISKMANFSSPYELVGVMKKPQYRESIVGNDVRLISSSEINPIVSAFMMSRSEMGVLQKFVKCIGPKAFICRSVWRKDKNNCAWVITNKNGFFEKDNLSEVRKYTTNPRIYNSSTIVFTNRGRFIDNTIPYLANIVKFLKDYAYVHLSELVGDFIEDESGIWWLINIRGFLFDESPMMNLRYITNFGEEVLSGNAGWTAKEKQRMIEGYQRLKMCKYCELMFPEDELNHKMTLKMIMQTDKHLQQRAKGFDWLARPEYQKHLDTIQLYQWHRVCQNCYELYEATVHLQETAFKFSKLLGIPLEEEKRTDMVSITTIQKQEAEIQERHAMPKDWRLDLPPDETKLILKNKADFDMSVPIDLTRYRVFIVFQSVRDVPRDINPNKNYYLEYTLFDTPVRYKMDLKKAVSVTPGNGKSTIVIPVSRARLFYFFSLKGKKIIDFLNTQKALTVHLYCDAPSDGTSENRLEKMGSVDFPLTDFLSDKVVKREFFKIFSGKHLPILAWGLQMTIGIIESGDEFLSKSKLTEHKGVYYTTNDYYTCESFPKEWVQIFTDKNDGGMSVKRTTKPIDFAGNTSLTNSMMVSPTIGESGVFKFGGESTPTRASLNYGSGADFSSSVQVRAKGVTESQEHFEDIDEERNPIEDMLLAEINELERSLKKPKSSVNLRPLKSASTKGLIKRF